MKKIMKTSKLIRLLCTLWAVASISLASAQTAAVVFDQGNQAFEKGDFSKAIQQYEAILESGQYSSDLYYNLGNAHYQNGALPQAILAYERALKLEPYHAECRQNLSMVRLEVKEEVAPAPVFFLELWWKNWQYRLSISAWFGLAIALFWLSGAGLVLWQMGKERSQRKWGFLGGSIAFALALLPLVTGVSAQKNARTLSDLGIIMEENISLQSAPAERSPALRRVYPGSRVEILEEKETWFKVQLNSGEEGWVMASSFERV
ncbi:MAG: tetratricopeptide repeat protein [Bacteroidota bacterium]